MRKLTLIAIISAAFFAGTFFTAFSIADATNGDNAWAKLVARVTNLENQLGGNSIKYVHLEDDDAGHTAGWNPESGDTSFFDIVEPDATFNSVIAVTVGTSNGNTCTPQVFEEGKIRVACDGGVFEGATLSYTVTNPP